MAPHPLQYSCLENPMDGGAWKAAVHGVAEGWTRLSEFTFTFHFHALEPTPVFLPGESQGWGEPGGLPSMGSHRVEHDLATEHTHRRIYLGSIFKKQRHDFTNKGPSSQGYGFFQ